MYCTTESKLTSFFKNLLHLSIRTTSTKYLIHSQCTLLITTALKTAAGRRYSEQQGGEALRRKDIAIRSIPLLVPRSTEIHYRLIAHTTLGACYDLLRHLDEQTDAEYTHNKAGSNDRAV